MIYSKQNFKVLHYTHGKLRCYKANVGSVSNNVFEVKMDSSVINMYQLNELCQLDQARTHVINVSISTCKCDKMVNEIGLSCKANLVSSASMLLIWPMY